MVKLASVGTGQFALLLLCALRVGLLAVPLSQLGVGPEVSNNMGQLLTRASLALLCTAARLHTAACDRAFLTTSCAPWAALSSLADSVARGSSGPSQLRRRL